MPAKLLLKDISGHIALLDFIQPHQARQFGGLNIK
jgi:hypothetical protein